MNVETARFGTIDVAEEEILRFPRGILAFEAIGRYVLLPHGEESPFQFLQAIDDPAVTFVVTNPLWLRPDYRVDVYREDLDDLGAKATDEVTVLAIVTVPRDGGDLTVNLLAPLLINPDTRLGKQVVQNESSYSTRHILREEVKRARRITQKPGRVSQALRTVG